MARTEKSGGEAIFGALEAPFLDVVVASDAVRELVSDEVAVAVARRRPRRHDDRGIVLRHGQLEAARRARHCTAAHGIRSPSFTV